MRRYLSSRRVRERTMSQAAQLEMDRRQSFSLQGALRPQRQGSLFEAFLVVGASPDSDVTEKTVKEVGLQPRVLHTFPQNYDLSKLEVSQFCFPTGIAPTLVRRSASESGLNAHILGPLTKLEENNNSFIILLTTDDCLLYGCCVHTDEMLRSSASFADQKKWTPTAREQHHIVAPRCYCILSKFPFFQLHFEILYSLLARERLYRIENSMAGVPFPDPKSNECIQLLQHYYDQPVPRESQSLKIKLPSEIRSLEFSCAPGHEDKLIVDRCLGCTFKMLSLDTVMALLAAMAQEYQIVLVSSNISVLSAVALSMIPLIRPFVWQGTFIPIVPNALKECLQAPVPFIMGVDSVESHILEDLQEAVVLDIDKNEFMNIPGKMATLPNRGDLYEKLCNQLAAEATFSQSEEARAGCMKKPYRSSPKELECLHEIVDELRDYFHQLLDHVLHAQDQCLPSPASASAESQQAVWDALSDEAMIEKIVNLVHEDERAFAKRLLETQHYRFYVEKIRKAAETK